MRVSHRSGFSPLVLFLLAATALVLLPAAVSAQDIEADVSGSRQAVGKVGIGFTTSNAPLGVRMWFSQGIGFDAGAGLVLNGNQTDVESDDPEETTTTADFAFDAGFLLAIHQADNSILFGRIGLNFDRDYAVGSEENDLGIPEPVHSSQETINVNAMVGFEFFLSALGFPEISLQAAVGLGFETVIPPASPADPDNDWSLGSLATDLNIVGNAQLGFHYYF